MWELSDGSRVFLAVRNQEAEMFNSANKLLVMTACIAVLQSTQDFNRPVMAKRIVNPNVDGAVKDMGGTDTSKTNKMLVPVQEISHKQAQEDAKTAKNTSKVAGVKITATDLQPPEDEKPIKGFHPIKRALAPIIRLEKNSVLLHQQIMKLNGPIAALQPTMNGLHGKMDKVDQRMATMDTHLLQMDHNVQQVGNKMGVVGSQMGAVSNDISQMRKDLTKLNGPLNKLLEPLSNVATPLEEVRNELNDVKALLASVLLAIVLATVIIVIGTPLAAIFVYKNRKKFFPDLTDKDLPVVPIDTNKENRDNRKLAKVSNN